MRITHVWVYSLIAFGIWIRWGWGRRGQLMRRGLTLSISMTHGETSCILAPLHWAQREWALARRLALEVVYQDYRASESLRLWGVFIETPIRSKSLQPVSSLVDRKTALAA